MPEVKLYLGSANDKMLDLVLHLKASLPHLNFSIKPINELKHGNTINITAKPTNCTRSV